MSAINHPRSEKTIFKTRILPWIVCFSASLFFAYELLQLHVMNALSPMLIKDLSLNATEFATLCSTYLWADVIFLLPAGMILDRFSVRRVILVALLFCLIGTAGLSQSTSLGFASLCHFFSGIGNAFCFLSCIMLISRWFPKERQAFLIGLMITIGMLGGIIAQRPFSILAERFSWRLALLIDAFIGVGLFAVIFTFVKDAPEKMQRVKTESLSFFQGVKRSILNFHNICCGLYICFMNLPLMIISAVWGNLFLTQVHRIELNTASFIASMICMGTIVGSPLFGWMSDKVGRRLPLMVFGGISSIILFGAILYLPNPGVQLFAVLFFALGFLTSSQTLGYPAITENNPRELTGISMGIAAVIIMGLPALIQPLSGKLLDWNWNGTMVDGAPFYSASDFHLAFLIFPIGFAISLLTLFKIKDCTKIVLEKAV
ncbi:MAG: MFS transporter [Simkaniaceae bacterium]|nr:MFS transporter [Simkaniaceae bacterium]